MTNDKTINKCNWCSKPTSENSRTVKDWNELEFNKLNYIYQYTSHHESVCDACWELDLEENKAKVKK